MPKGKKCIKCKKGRMRRCYTRSYHKGLRFTEEDYLGKEVPKGAYNPKGWLCDKCAYFIPDELEYNSFQQKQERKAKKIIRILKQEIKSLKKYLRRQREYIYSKKDLELELRIQRQRAYHIFSEKATYNFLKGLKKGYKDAKKHHKEEIESLTLTDDQIIKQAEIIQRERKAGIRS